jgi:hypothetical protein
VLHLRCSDFPLDQVAFVPDVDNVVQGQLDGMPGGNETGEVDNEDDNHEHPEINPVDAHLMLQTLETLWLHQDEIRKKKMFVPSSR